MIAEIHVFRTDERAEESQGYTVQLADGRRVVREYTAGANPHCSQSPGVSPTRTVKRWARQTARDLFEEQFGRPPRRDEVTLDVIRAGDWF